MRSICRVCDAFICRLRETFIYIELMMHSSPPAPPWTFYFAASQVRDRPPRIYLLPFPFSKGWAKTVSKVGNTYLSFPFRSPPCDSPLCAGSAWVRVWTHEYAWLQWYLSQMCILAVPYTSSPRPGWSAHCFSALFSIYLILSPLIFLIL